ncbi:hypothetical protein Aspvir_009166 [Aspergillus viridinutans]|uniref:DUF7703 domain-containing protein n=1 Tax=Aspergillus viridinutans TaxID=75553 RepID=A0A9P3F4B6_ASPVI|nr:uncharacterized protein Aspvir_009166 [Aspergillus viridinutans]GIK05067.1 hypothetical protein Aspvir_009166 [Aspergillus viridinutans]
MCVLTVLGWYAMVTGQSVVLYSRLHLVTSDAKNIRWVLYMIIINFCILHVPVTILFLGSNANVKNFVEPFNIYERIQLAGFSTQEIIISCLYMWEATKMLKPILGIVHLRSQGTMVHLLIVNILVVLLDASLLATEYSNNFDIQTTYKTVVYSIKLKMEFSVLNRLVRLAQSRYPLDSCVYQDRWPEPQTHCGDIVQQTHSL